MQGSDAATATQARILDATLKLVGERGFHGTPISAIAKSAGVGAGTIYRYYKSKEDLLNDLYLREKRTVHRNVLRGYSREMHSRDAIRLIWENWIADRVEHPARARFLDQYFHSPFIADETKRAQEQILAEYFEIIERGVSSGELRPLLPMAALTMILAPPKTIADAQSAGMTDDPEALFEQLLESVWRSIRAE